MDRATTTLWSREEVKVLVNHLWQHPGEKGNVRLRELLPAKTPKQLSEKKRSKIILNLVDAMQEADPEPTEEIPPTEEVEPEEEVEAAEETVPDEAEEVRASDRGGTSSESEAEHRDILTNIRVNLEGPEDTREDRWKTIQEAVGELIDRLGKKCEDPEINEVCQRKKPAERRRRVSMPRNQIARRTAEKRRCYRRVQRLYSFKRSKLAKEILDGQVDVPCGLKPDEVAAFYEEKLATVHPSGDLTDVPPAQPANNTMLRERIRCKEVKDAIMTTPAGSAAGLDAISLKEIRKWDANGRKLTVIFEAFRKFGRVPDELKTNRSILLPKSDDPEKLSALKNWRPITIGNHVLRLYTKVLARRLLRSVHLQRSQRGFIPTNGCFENVFGLAHTIRRAKMRGEELSVVFIDLAKAFDSIPHEHIRRSLRRFQVDESFIQMVTNLYDGASTAFTVRRGVTTKTIPIKAGVKQGDPLSPILFNLAIDPLMAMLQATGEGVETPGGRVAAMAFADDMVLLCNTHEGMNRLLETVRDFSLLSGLQVNIEKCAGFHIQPFRRTWLINSRDPWKMSGKNIPALKPGDTLRYLGANIDP